MADAHAKVAVIGAGPMGLAAAYFLARRGCAVDVFEASPVPGGMAAHFDFGGLSIERFYHFICKSDQPLFDLLGELGLADKLTWRDTSMGFYCAGALHRWGDPIALLRFPHLSLTEKFRYGLQAFLSTRRRGWEDLDRLAAHDWLKSWLGERAYSVCWEPLLKLKFFDLHTEISAAWVWTRIKRVGTSRKSIFQEQLGYLEGGSETLVRELVERIEALGGKVACGTPVERIAITDGRVSGVVVGGELEHYDQVISTVAMPYASQMLEDVPARYREMYRALKNVAVVCVIHKLRRPVSEHFWVNISDESFEIPGIIEFSNLRDTRPDHVVYVPYYMPQSHPKYGWSDQAFVDETTGYLKALGPHLDDADFVECRVGRLKYAQPVCGPRFLETLPPICPGVEGLQVADTSYYYPEDRGVSESIRLAAAMADRIQPA